MNRQTYADGIRESIRIVGAMLAMNRRAKSDGYDVAREIDAVKATMVELASALWVAREECDPSEWFTASVRR